MAQQDSHYSLLSDKGILRSMETGKIIIEPFHRDCLSTSSYDVTLGPYFYRESIPEPGLGIYNPFSEDMVNRVWGSPQEAELVSEFSKRTGITLENISLEERIIWIAPGETILAHTNEFIGGRQSVTTMMKARSSLGRNFIEICKCAGWGDVGYVNRWTMEITNNSRHYSIPLVVGRRVAQIVFFDSEGTVESASYEQSGKYQTSSDVETLKSAWSPIEMLPKMYRDREVARSKVKSSESS
eukprot:TRINITY_DN645_c0_g2_i1.p1 TRINITY_DN645_c0_g2~~TRINITY_DN645_c0_g2_i1.p1  ORF type:complete len:241 (-),score=33.55 TRINITY_DN645_c0_g2_i1:120-842(-)